MPTPLNCEIGAEASRQRRIEDAGGAARACCYNNELKSRNFIVPGLIAVILMIIAALLTSLTIAREWENGTMEQLLSTPVRPMELLLGKMCAYFVLGMVDMVIALIVGVGVFGVPLRGSVLLLAAGGALFLFGALCWGILLSAVTRSQLLAYQVSLLSSFLPAFLLSGFIYSIDNMPFVIQQFTRIVPARYFVAILKGIFLKGVGLEVLWPQFIFLLAYAAIIFTIASARCEQRSPEYTPCGNGSARSSARSSARRCASRGAGRAVRPADHADAHLRLRRQPGRRARQARLDGSGPLD